MKMLFFFLFLKKRKIYSNENDGNYWEIYRNIFFSLLSFKMFFSQTESQKTKRKIKFLSFISTFIKKILNLSLSNEMMKLESFFCILNYDDL